MKTVVILGAGFSFVAGLPLARVLFDSKVLITSNGAERRFNAVWDEWKKWHKVHSNQGAEQFLTALYRTDPSSRTVPWEWAVELVSATLATPINEDFPVIRNPRYAGRVILNENKFICSMSHKGNCYDNAPMESFWGKLKQEWLYGNRFKTRTEAKAAIFEYIEVFYNRQRKHSSCGYRTPMAVIKAA